MRVLKFVGEVALVGTVVVLLLVIVSLLAV